MRSLIIDLVKVLLMLCAVVVTYGGGGLLAVWWAMSFSSPGTADLFARSLVLVVAALVCMLVAALTQDFFENWR